jgi:hypothetical protein
VIDVLAITVAVIIGLPSRLGAPSWRGGCGTGARERGYSRGIFMANPPAARTGGRLPGRVRRLSRRRASEGWPTARAARQGGHCLRER